MKDGRFVGRAAELRTVESMVAAAAGGLGGTLVVSGEQGIGKSALLEQGLAGAERLGCRLCWGTADELQQRFPLRLMLECLGDEGRQALAEERDGALAGSLVSGDPVAAAAERLLTLVHRWCTASPVVVVTEDLQWADEASLLLWQRLARLVEQLPLLLVGSFRPGPGGQEAEHLTGSAARWGTAMPLGPLDPVDAAQIAAGLVGAPVGGRLADVIERAGGNPMYVRELVAGLARDGRVAVAAGVADLAEEGLAVPVSLAAAIEGRLAELSSEVAAALRWGAVLGPDFSVTDLGLVTGRPAEELAAVADQAVAAGVVAGKGARLTFRHGLIRQALYEAMPATVREALHLQAAQMLAQAGEPAERVAAQLAAAPEAGGEWMWQWVTEVAGELAYRAPQVTAELLRRVLAQLPEADRRREALESTLVEVAFLLGRGEELEQVASRLLTRADEPDRAAEAAWLLGYSMAWTGRRAEAAAAVVDAALARPGMSEGQIARLLALRAMLMLATGQPQAAATAREALAKGERSGDRLAAGHALRALGVMALYGRDHAAMLDHADRALALIGDHPHTADLRLLLLHDRAEALMDLDRQAEASATIRQLLALADQAGTPPRLVQASHVAAQVSFDTGQWDDAVAVLEPAIGMPSQDGTMLNVRGLLALIAAHRDDWDTTETHIAAVQGDQAQSTRDPEGLYSFLLAQALIAERARRPGEGSALLTQCLGRGVASGPRREVVLPSLARLALAAGDHVVAGAAARAAAKEADREPLPVKTAVADHTRGLLDSDPGPVLAAAAYYQSAGRLPARAWALEDAAVLLADRGEHTAARQAFISATREYLRLGAEWDLRHADARLRPYGIRRGRGGRRPAAARAGWQALTPTETKVAALVAEGRSNPDIAAELFLSRNTVQTHVSHILAKLGARSRAEIVREAIQQARGKRPGDRSWRDGPPQRWRSSG